MIIFEKEFIFKTNYRIIENNHFTDVEMERKVEKMEFIFIIDFHG